MISHLRSFRKKNSDAVAKVIEGINETYKCIENYPRSYIEAVDYHGLHIKCEDLFITTEGTHQSPLTPVFFDSIGVSNIPPPDLDNERTQDDLKHINDSWGEPPPIPITMVDEVYGLWYFVHAHFRYFVRERPTAKHGRTLMRRANWLPCENISPDIVSEEFDGPIFQSRDWMPGAAWRDVSDLKLPHTMESLLKTGVPDQRLLKSEALAIAAVMITRLEGGSIPEHTVVPMMVITIFGDWCLNILEAHYSHEGLVIRKSQFLHFGKKEDAIPNMERVMSFMASRKIGDTKDPKIMIKPELPEPISSTESRDTTQRTGTLPVRSGSIGHMWRTLRGQSPGNSQSATARRQSPARPPIPDFSDPRRSHPIPGSPDPGTTPEVEDTRRFSLPPDILPEFNVPLFPEMDVHDMRRWSLPVIDVLLSDDPEEGDPAASSGEAEVPPVRHSSSPIEEEMSRLAISSRDPDPQPSGTE